MRTELYSIAALGMRYVFCGLALVIVFRAWRITVVDNRRARILRMIMPEVASVGEFIASGGIVGKQRIRYLIPREGIIGASGGADISIRHPNVHRKHAFFELREGGLLIRPLRDSRITLENGTNIQQLILRDGDTVMLGQLKLTLVLFDASKRSRETKTVRNEAEWPYDENNEIRTDEFFEEEAPWQDKREGKETRKK